MKVAKKALLGTALAGAMVVSAGFGTYSWFTDVKTANGTIDNGSLTLGMDTELFAHKKFAPSQVLLSDYKTIENTGDLDQVLRATYTHSINKASIKKYKVAYLAMKYTGNIDEAEKVRFKSFAQKGFENGNSNIVMDNGLAKKSVNYEVEAAYLSEEQVNALQAKKVSNEETIKFGKGKFWKLNEGQKIDIFFMVKLLDSAGNEYQGAHYDAEFKVEAKQTEDGAEFGPEAGTQPTAE